MCISVFVALAARGLRVPVRVRERRYSPQRVSEHAYTLSPPWANWQEKTGTRVHITPDSLFNGKGTGIFLIFSIDLVGLS